MLINLVANAGDASLANGSQAVYVRWAPAGSNVQIMIEDCGLDIANPENLFVPFYTTKPSNSGIGLVLSQQIAPAPGGEIALADRKDGAGARGTVRLLCPLIAEQDSDHGMFVDESEIANALIEPVLVPRSRQGSRGITTEREPVRKIVQKTTAQRPLKVA